MAFQTINLIHKPKADFQLSSANRHLITNNKINSGTDKKQKAS